MTVPLASLIFKDDDKIETDKAIVKILVFNSSKICLRNFWDCSFNNIISLFETIIEYYI